MMFIMIMRMRMRFSRVRVVVRVVVRVLRLGLVRMPVMIVMRVLMRMGQWRVSMSMAMFAMDRLPQMGISVKSCDDQGQQDPPVLHLAPILALPSSTFKRVSDLPHYL
ncbi:MAG: hypothetical protein M3Z35_02850 [Nitrospirota bacterium]|nr:hypothetical protein [Nitrospirota bacterium]